VRTTFPVSAGPEAWTALADPARLAAALPGCRSVTRDADGDGTLHVVADVAVASVQGLWAGTAAPVDADAVRIRGSGAPGSMDLIVRADPGRTVLSVDGTVDGPLGTVGSAVLAAAFRRLAEDLLAAVGKAPPVPMATDPGEGSGASITVAPTGPVADHRLRRAVTVAAVPAGVVVSIVLASRRRGRRRAG
jgi:carbon monoxide dehydrogenase subunit G